MSYDWNANLPEAFGPVYPELGAKVAKSRRLARNHPIWRREHGLVVLEAIRANRLGQAMPWPMGSAPASIELEF